MKNFTNLLENYISDIKQSLTLLNRHFLDKDKTFFQKNRQGYLNNKEKSYFQFHGYGCLLIIQGKNIDFELPYFKEKKIPIDLYFLIDYWKSIDSNFYFTHDEQIIEAFNKLKQNPSIKVNELNFNQIFIPYDGPFLEIIKTDD